MTAESLQDARRGVVRDRVLAGIATLLADGRDLTFANVAAAAEVPERTVYRHFANRAELMSALVEWVNQRAGATQRATTGEAATEMVRHAFSTFDEVAPVVRALMVSPDGLTARLADNDARRTAALSVVDSDAPGLDDTTRRQLAAVVQLLTSASAWQSLRDYWDMDGHEAADAVATALTLLMEGARHNATLPSRTRSATTPTTPTTTTRKTTTK